MILITTYPSLALSSTSLPKMRKATRKLLTSFLGNLIKTCISEHFMSEISSLHEHSQIKVLRNRMDSMEQYYRCTCLKFSGITEERGENTDNIVLRIANQFILSKEQQPMELHQISRSHIVGPPRDNKIPRDIIVRFVSYRDKSTSLRRKKNLKNFNKNPSNKYKNIRQRGTYQAQSPTALRSQVTGKQQRTRQCMDL